MAFSVIFTFFLKDQGVFLLCVLTIVLYATFQCLHDDRKEVHRAQPFRSIQQVLCTADIRAIRCNDFLFLSNLRAGGNPAMVTVNV